MKNWHDATIPQMVEALGREKPTAPAIVFKDRTTSFGELAATARRVSNYLVANGMRPDDRVALMLPPSDTWAAIHYGVIGAGCIAVPINLAFKADELRFVLKQSRAKCIIVADTNKGVDLAGRIEEILPALTKDGTNTIDAGEFPALEMAVLLSESGAPRGSWRPALDMLTFEATHAVEEELEKRRSALTPTQSCAIVYTSGSTSFPKPALLHHRGLMGGAWWYGEGSAIAEDERIMGFAPTFHVSGISAGMMVPHMRGLPIWLLDGFEPGAALDLIEKHSITMFSGFDTMFVTLLRHPAFSSERVKSIRSLRLATGPAMHERVYAAFPNLAVTARCYAMTETCGPSAVTYPDMRSLDAVKYSNGIPVPGMEIRIAALSDGRTVPTGETGEIRLKGPALFNGYLDMEAETRAAFDEGGWFRTGDLGRMDEAGLLYLAGRLKRMIKTGGENVSEREIEIFLEDKVAGVCMVQVVGIPDPVWGEAVIAFVEAFPDSDINELAVREACKAGLANFKVPKRVFFVGGTEWPRNDVGKISKDALIAQAIEATRNFKEEK